MAVFKTPLFRILATYLCILSVLFYRGYLDGPALSAPKDFYREGFHVFEGKVLQNLARGWKIETISIDEKQEKTHLLFLLPRRLQYQGLLPGAHIVFWGVFQEPEAAQWEGLFDWKNHLAKEGVSGVAKVDRFQDMKVLAQSRMPTTLLYRFHEQLVGRIAREFARPKVAGLLSGILLGDKRLLEETMKESFIRSGVMHLLVASGLHVALAFSFFFTLFVYIFRLNRSTALLGAVGLTWAFAVFIGLNPPVWRAAFMITILSMTQGLKREMPALTRLFLACFVLLLVKPGLIEDASFILSFASTFGILYGWNIFEPSGSTRFQWLLEGALASFFAWASLLPFSAALFHEITLVGVISNLILVPLSSLLLGLGAIQFFCLEWLPIVGGLGRIFLNYFAQLFLGITDFFAKIPYASIACPSWGPLAVGAWLCILFGFGFAKTKEGISKKAAYFLVLSCIFLGADIAKRALGPAYVELLWDKEEPVAVHIEKGFLRIFCLKEPIDTLSPSQDALKEYIKYKGHTVFVNDCLNGGQEALKRSLNPGYRVGDVDLRWESGFKSLNRVAFHNENFIKIPCGAKTLIFPSSLLYEGFSDAKPYPLIKMNC